MTSKVVLMVLERIGTFCIRRFKVEGMGSSHQSMT